MFVDEYEIKQCMIAYSYNGIGTKNTNFEQNSIVEEEIINQIIKIDNSLTKKYILENVENIFNKYRIAVCELGFGCDRWLIMVNKY